MKRQATTGDSLTR